MIEKFKYTESNYRETNIKIRIMSEFQNYSEEYISSTDDIISTLDLLPANIIKVLSEDNLIINYIDIGKFFFLNKQKKDKVKLNNYIYEDDKNYNNLTYKERKVFSGKAYTKELTSFYPPCTNHIFLLRKVQKKTILHEIGHFLDNILQKENDFNYRNNIIELQNTDEDYISSIMHISNNELFLNIYKKYLSHFKEKRYFNWFQEKKVIYDKYYFNKRKEFFAESFAQYLYNGEKFRDQFRDASEYIEKFIINYDSLREEKSNKFIIT